MILFFLFFLKIKAEYFYTVITKNNLRFRKKDEANNFNKSPILLNYDLYLMDLNVESLQKKIHINLIVEILSMKNLILYKKQI